MPDKRQSSRRGSKASRASSADSPRSARPGKSATGCTDWLWWQAGPGNASPAKKDYYAPRTIPTQVRAEFDKKRNRYKLGTLRNGADIKSLGHGLLELRYSHTGNTPYRLVFTRWGEFAVVLDVFKKTTDATPTAKALRRQADWVATFGDAPAG